MSGQYHDTNHIDDIEPITEDNSPTGEHASGGYKVALEREDRTPAERIIRRLREKYQDWKEKRERKKQAKRVVGIPEHSTGGSQRERGFGSEPKSTNAGAMSKESRAEKATKRNEASTNAKNNDEDAAEKAARREMVGKSSSGSGGGGGDDTDSDREKGRSALKN